ncbi:MAG TPA: hypothetical protein VGM91_24190 [Conexibacter sp.]|jgi:hypothetical protein
MPRNARRQIGCPRPPAQLVASWPCVVGEDRTLCELAALVTEAQLLLDAAALTEIG